MTNSTRSIATLAYLVAVLLLGGASAGGYSGNTLLQFAGAGLVGWVYWASAPGEASVTGLRRFLIAVAVLIAVQFLPLPPALWTHMPGRGAIAQGFALAGEPLPWLTLSLAPWKSIASFAWWIPAIALFVAMRAESAPSARSLIWTITTVAAVSVVLGALQQAGTGYLYIVTNYGEGPGFFANSNHQGSFVLTTLALWTGWIAAARQQPSRCGPGRFGGSQTVLLAIAGLLIMGVLVSGSLACLSLLLPVTVASLFIARPQLRVALPVIVVGAVVVVGGFVAFLLFGPIANDLTAKGAVAGISRGEFLVNGVKMLRDYLPFGSGVGTFQDLYRWYENPAQVGTTYVNHAHDDLLELLIETGLFGLAAVGLFLVWFAPRAWNLWTNERNHPVALAASVVIAVELLHSLVDYPLRTAAMSSVMAIACVLLVRQPETQRNRRRDLRPSEHTDGELLRI
ncbi:MAG TPA: O-antigen ligase family protein [Novosphingobium sp.]|nr:O-antigen ligase family protein [Novosphingobium sp.]